MAESDEGRRKAKRSILRFIYVFFLIVFVGISTSEILSSVPILAYEFGCVLVSRFTIRCSVFTQYIKRPQSQNNHQF